MKKPLIYVDTSVIGGCFDVEFKEWSDALMEDFRNHRYIPVLSDVTAAEVFPAPSFVRTLYDEILSLPAQIVHVNEDAVALVQCYVERSVLGERFTNDMLHIALSTIAEVDVLVSWNFKHIVRLDKIRLFNAVNLEQGYKPLTIYSPREVISHAEED